MLPYASAQAMPLKKQPKKRQRQRQTTLFGSAEDSEADKGCSSEVAEVDGAEDPHTTPQPHSHTALTVTLAHCNITIPVTIVLW